MYTQKDLIYTSLFTSEEVDSFVTKRLAHPFVPAVIRNRQNIDVSDPSKRKSERQYIPFDIHDHFITKLMAHIVWCNEKVFKFPNMTYTSTWELLRYNEGDFFGRHHDRINTNVGPFISAAVYLQDQEEFEGGETLFYKTDNTAEHFKLRQQKGYVVVYPSQIYHEVTRVTSGTRLALVSFFIASRHD